MLHRIKQQHTMSILRLSLNVEVTIWRDADNSRQIRAKRETDRQAEGQMEVLKRYLGKELWEGWRLNRDMRRNGE